MDEKAQRGIKKSATVTSTSIASSLLFITLLPISDLLSRCQIAVVLNIAADANFYMTIPTSTTADGTKVLNFTTTMTTTGAFLPVPPLTPAKHTLISHQYVTLPLS